MRLLPLALRCLFGILLALASATAAPPRLAVLDFSEGKELEAVFVAELSKSGEVELVERAEIGRLVEEKRLTDLAGAGKFVGLGSLLKADGLLIFDAGAGPKKTLRLISVRTGMCLLVRTFDVSKEEAPGSAVSLLAGLVQRHAGKLSVPVENAIPLAVVNIRAGSLTKEDTEAEKPFTRLLEASLGSQPEVVLLERRRLTDVQFERSLDATDAPALAQAAYLIDGTFEHKRTGDVTFTLRVRKRDDGRLQAISFTGQWGDLSQLANDVAARVLATLKPGLPLAARAPIREAAEFLAEARWARWEWDLPIVEEALNAAMALGDISADAYVLRTWCLIQQVAPRDAARYDLPPLITDPPQRLAATLEAMRAYRSFQSQQIVECFRYLHDDYRRLERNDLRTDIVRAASKVLMELEEGGFRNVHELRRQVQVMAGFDPAGKSAPIDMILAGEWASIWANNLEDTISFYSYWFKSNERKRLFLLSPKSQLMSRFPRRFKGDPRVPGALKKLGEELAGNEPTKLTGLLILLGIGATDGKEKEMYARTMEALLARTEELEAAEEFYGYFGLLRKQHSAYPEYRTMYVQFLRRLKTVQASTLDIIFQNDYPEPEARELWSALLELRKRCFAHQTKVENLPLRVFARLTKEFLKRHPFLLEANVPNLLPVTRYWHPWSLVSEDQKPYVGEVYGVGDSVWFTLGFDRNEKLSSVIEVTLPSLETKTRLLHPRAWAGRVLVEDDAIFMASGRSLFRYDRKTAAWESRPFHETRTRAMIGGKLYLTIVENGEFAIAQYDWPTGETTLLASPRRRPAQNQLDGESGGTYEFFEMSGQRACTIGTFAVHRSVLVMQREPGHWASPMKVAVNPAVQQFQNCTLLKNADNQFVFIDPARAETEIWSGKPGTDSGEGFCDLPVDKIDGTYAFRRDELFYLHLEDGRYHLYWFWKGGPRNGIVIPLDFQMAAASAEALQKSKFGNNIFTKETVLHPPRDMMPLRFEPTPQGLVLQTVTGPGFWFIPNADLEAARKNYRAPAGEAQK